MVTSSSKGNITYLSSNERVSRNDISHYLNTYNTIDQLLLLVSSLSLHNWTTRLTNLSPTYSTSGKVDNTHQMDHMG